VLFPEYYCEVFFFLAHLGRPSSWPLWSHGCSARPPIAAGGWYKHLGGRFPAVLGVARVLPIGPGGAQSGFSTLRYVSRDFRKKKAGPRTPRPPGAPPVLGSLVCSAEGLPSTRNWPFRWPLSPTSPPQVTDTQGNVSRLLARAVVLGGGAAPAPPLAGSRRSCASPIRVA
jgi:hypothetical protein